MEFIRDHRPIARQLVVALVDDAGINLGGDVLELKDKRRLLRSVDYEVIATERQALHRRNYGLLTRGSQPSKAAVTDHGPRLVFS